MAYWWKGDAYAHECWGIVKCFHPWVELYWKACMVGFTELWLPLIGQQKANIRWSKCGGGLCISDQSWQRKYERENWLVLSLLGYLGEISWKRIERVKLLSSNCAYIAPAYHAKIFSFHLLSLKFSIVFFVCSGNLSPWA